MHRKMTKFFSMFLSAALMAGTLSVSVPAEEVPAVFEASEETEGNSGEIVEDDFADSFTDEETAAAGDKADEGEDISVEEDSGEETALDTEAAGIDEEESDPENAEGVLDENGAEDTQQEAGETEAAEGAVSAAVEEEKDDNSVNEAGETAEKDKEAENIAEEAAMDVEGGEAVQKAMDNVSLAGIKYFYVNTAGDADNTRYCFSVTTGRGSNAVTTNYEYGKADLTQVAKTDYYYIVMPGATALTGTLYGFADESGAATNYKKTYGDLGISDVSDPAYDAVTSATGFTGHHVKDIPSLVTFGTDVNGNKAITGLRLGRGQKSVDALSYVEAAILQAAGAELTKDQQDALDITLKANPMTAPSESDIPVKAAGASFTTSRYGAAEFAIVPDDTVEGYTWSEYWGSVYGAVISDGKKNVGAVHWIDLYGEAATSGPHYNKLEIALNNGESKGSNKADVSRYAAFFDNGHIKAGNYNITVYAEGYTPLKAQVEIGAVLSDKNAVYSGKEISVDPAVVTGLEGDVVYTYYSDAACTKNLDSLPKNPGTYYVKAVVADLAVSNTACLTISKAASTVSLKEKTAVYNGRAVSIDKAEVTGSTGAVSYAYYSDAACTKKLTGAPVNAGTYYVKAALEEDADYNAAESSPVKLTINKAASSVTLKAKAVTYTGKSISIAKAVVKGTKGKVTYTYYTDAKCTKKAKAHTNAGTYYVKAFAAGDANYGAASSKAVKFVIKKAAQKINVSSAVKKYSAKNLKKKAQVFSIGAKATGKGKLTYKKISGSGSLSLNAKTGEITVKKGVKKGTYTIKVRIKAAANNNYKAKEVKKIFKVVVK